MKLTISATLTDEQVVILATAKGWSEKIVIVGQEESINPVTASEFIVNVYQAMIVNDATNVFSSYRTQQLKEQIKQTEQIVKTDIENAIISSIE